MCPNGQPHGVVGEGSAAKIRSVHSHERAARQAVEDPRRIVRGPAERPEDDYLSALQRQIGNQAVTLMVQRQRRERPAPTDAPGAKKPPKKEAPKKPISDFTARIVGYQVAGGKTVITIASGDHEVHVGMPGSLLRKDGSEGEDFEIDAVRGGQCSARVSATPDQVNENPYVIVKATKYVPPSPGASEHA